MNYIGRLIPKSVKEFYYEINSATLTGAIDVVVVEQADGSFLCSPFHVRFGKLGVLRSKEKIVDIEINGEPVDIHMKLGDTGEAFFVEEIDEDEDESLPSHLATSPFPGAVSSADYLATQLEKLKISQEESDAKQIEDDDDDDDDVGVVVVSGGNDQENGERNRVLQITASPPSSEERMPNGEIVCIEKNSDDNGSEASPVTEDNYVSVADTVPNDANHDSIESTSPILAEEQFQPSLTNLKRGLISVGVQTTDLGNLEVEDYRNGGSVILPATVVQQQKRRKRRKHSMNKRSINSRSKDNLSEISPYIANLNPTFSLDPMDDIFHMDDDWDDDSSTVVGESMTRSSSVPTPSFYANKLNTPKTQYSVSVSDFHPYSDGELTPRGAATPERRGSLGRPSSPKSDTEFEITRRDATSQTDPGEVSWPWGELPQVFHKGATPRKNSPNAQGPASPQDEVTSRSEGTQSKGSQRKSVVGGILNFIKNKEEQSNKKSNVEDKGIYLDDLNPDSIDPEVAELYFPKLRSQVPLKKSVKDDDAESGNGPSLPHSPQCVSSGPQSIDSDSDQERTLYGICDYRKFYDVKLSLCGGMKPGSGLQQPDRFEQFVVSYDEFRKNASNILQNPDLVIQVGGKYYSWRAAAPMIVSLVVFQQPLPESVLGSLNDIGQQKKKTESRGSWWSWRRSHTVANSETLSINSTTEPTTSTTATTTTAINQENKQIDQSSPENTDAGIANTSNTTPTLTTTVSTGTTTTADAAAGTCDVTDRAVTDVSAEELPLFQEENSYESSKMDERALSEAEYVDDEIMAITGNRYVRKNSSYKKTLRLSTEQIKSLSLKDGANEVVFSVTTAYQGTSRCMCHIYLWRHDDKIIISDIDGTITKSDVFGHILPMLGVDWAQSGVANLFTKINDNGYKLLYLSARAIGQARTTREYLKSVRQGEVCLPDGPLLLSPTSLISAFHREVIEKKPEEFKISCLRDIQTLFPTNPFYAGFGNKINDTWAYRAVGIPPSRIFTINHRGELKLELIQYFQSTYTSLSDVVDHMFPPVPRSFTKGTDFLSEYSSYMYWKEPITTIDCDDPFLKTVEAQVSATAASVPQPKKPVK